VAAGFLDLPERSPKPRDRGLTHVLDKGLSCAEVDGLMEVAGDAVDIGGTLTEIALRDGRLDGLIAWCKELGIAHVEVSDGTIALDAARKREIVARLSRDFTVFSEVGSKDDERIMAPYRWVEEIEAELAAGAWKVIAEARESGTAGIFRPDGEVRMGLIDEIVHAIDPARLIFEAPQRAQQVWFLKRFGREVNLGNIAPGDVLSLETLRLGLRSDTMSTEPERP
jgi:phosphosulfolactate synthase